MANRFSIFGKINDGGWRTIMDYQGSRFFQAVNRPDVFMRGDDLGNGKVRYRYAWDGDGMVRDSLTDISRAIADADDGR